MSYVEHMPATLVEALERAAARWPRRIAFTCDGRTLDYATLNARANRLGHWLRAGGTRRGDLVALSLPRSLEGVIAAYGTLKAGAAYVPLDPAAPPAVLAATLREHGIATLVTRPSSRSVQALLAEPDLPLERVLGGANGGGAGTRARVDDWCALESLPADGRPAGAGPPRAHDLAYVLHSSGSTGRAKGIAHTHDGALSFVASCIEACGLRASDTLACHAPLHTDMSTLGLLVAPVLGARTVVVSEAHARVPASLAELIERERISVWYSVPLALIQLLRHGGLERRRLGALRQVIYAGEALAPRYLRTLMERLPQARFTNLYGPAETNVCTGFRIPPDARDRGLLEADRQVPIGRPWPGNETLVVDGAGRPVVPGEAGELLVRSRATMRGYLGRPDLDERAFVDDPRDPGRGRYYRTGDLVRETEPYGYEFLGRRDRQIKCRGFRVELDAVESRLCELPGVIEVAVFARPTAERDALEIHAAVLADDPALDAATFLDLAARHLAPAAVPTRARLLDALPRTPSGKVDRRRLAAGSNP